MDQLGECTHGVLSDCLFPCRSHSSIDAHVDLRYVVGCTDIQHTFLRLLFFWSRGGERVPPMFLLDALCHLFPGPCKAAILASDSISVSSYTPRSCYLIYHAHSCKNGCEPFVIQNKDQTLCQRDPCRSSNCSEKESTLCSQDSVTKDAATCFPGTPVTYTESAHSSRPSSFRLSFPGGDECLPHGHV